MAARKTKEPEPEISFEEKPAGPNGLPFNPIEEGRPALNYQEIKGNLAVLIPPEWVSYKVRKGRNNQEVKIEYVNVTVLKDFLDERAGNWTAEVKSTTVMGNQIGIVVRLSIECLDGWYFQDGTGIEELNHSSFGDSYSNAYAQAFRRACEGHGLGRELWRKSDVHQAEYDRHAPEPQQRQPQPTAGQNSGSYRSPQQSAPQGNGGGRPEEPMTEKQRKFIDNMSVDNNLNHELISLEMFKKTFDEISKREASKLIEHMDRLSKQRT